MLVLFDLLFLLEKSTVHVFQNNATKARAKVEWRLSGTLFCCKYTVLKIEDIHKLQLAIFTYNYKSKMMPHLNEIYSKKLGSEPNPYFVFEQAVVED